MAAKLSLKIKIGQALNRFPRTKVLLNRALMQWSKWTFLRNKGKKEGYFDFRVIEVPPDRIQNALNRCPFHKWHDKGKIMDGDWDKNIIPFKELPIYQSFRDHFKNNIPWQETQFYQIILKQIESGSAMWGCTNSHKLDARFGRLEDLHENIRDNGYKCQFQIAEKKETYFRLFDEITVCISRDGELMFHDGRHRLAITKLLNLETIPVQVTVRHRKWHEFRNEILAYARKNGGKVYAPLLHPDLVDIPSTHSHTRFELIQANLPLKKGTLLDIGAHWGYFCHRFEDLGFTCYAAESSSLAQYFLEKLKRAENKNFHVIKQSILDYHEKTDFDVVLALNILHHFLKTKERYKLMIKLLKRLDVQIMFLGTHVYSEHTKPMKEVYGDYNPDGFVEFVLSNSCLNEFKQIGQSENGRNLYMLWK